MTLVVSTALGRGAFGTRRFIEHAILLSPLIRCATFVPYEIGF